MMNEQASNYEEVLGMVFFVKCIILTEKEAIHMEHIEIKYEKLFKNKF